MRRLMVVAGMLAALLAMSVTMVATASAVEGLLPELTPLTGTSGKGTLADINGNSISCTSDTLSGAEFKNDTEGLFTDIDFKGCKAFGLFAANSAGDGKEVILTGPGKLEICLLNGGAKLEFGVYLTLLNTVVIEVTAAKAKVEVKGTVIASLAENKLSKTKTATFKQTKGVAALKECGGKKAQLLASLNGGAFVEAGEETEETLSATNGKTELILMDT